MGKFYSYLKVDKSTLGNFIRASPLNLECVIKYNIRVVVSNRWELTNIGRTKTIENVLYPKKN